MIRDRDGFLPIHTAMNYGNFGFMDTVLQHNKLSNLDDALQTKVPDGNIIHLAVQSGYTAIDLLRSCSKRKDLFVEGRPRDGNTPLHVYMLEASRTSDNLQRSNPAFNGSNESSLGSFKLASASEKSCVLLDNLMDANPSALSTKNEAGRTPYQERVHELQELLHTKLSQSPNHESSSEDKTISTPEQLIQDILDDASARQVRSFCRKKLPESTAIQCIHGSNKGMPSLLLISHHY